MLPPPLHVRFLILSYPPDPPDLIYGDEHAGHVVLAGHDAGQLPLEVDHVADLPGVVGTVVDSLVQEGDDAREVLEEGRRALRVGVTVELLRGESDPSCNKMVQFHLIGAEEDHPTLVDEELVLAGVVHPLADVPVEEGVGVVPLHRPQLLPQAESPVGFRYPRAGEAPPADVGDDGPQGVGAQRLDVAREVEAGAVEQLRLLLRQRAPTEEGRRFGSFVGDCPKSRQLVCICILGLPFPGGIG